MTEEIELIKGYLKKSVDENTFMFKNDSPFSDLKVNITFFFNSIVPVYIGHAILTDEEFADVLSTFIYIAIKSRNIYLSFAPEEVMASFKGRSAYHKTILTTVEDKTVLKIRYGNNEEEHVILHGNNIKIIKGKKTVSGLTSNTFTFSTAVIDGVVHVEAKVNRIGIALGVA